MQGGPVRAIVFDLFDTLVDLRFEDFPTVRVGDRDRPSSLEILHSIASEHTVIAFEAFADTLTAVDRELRPHHYDRGIELSTRVRFRHVSERLGVAGDALSEAMAGAHLDLFRRHSRAPADSEPLLADLHRDFRLGLCSNFSDSATALSILEGSRLRCHLDAVAISDAVRWRKPRSEIFEFILAELGVKPGETVHVGDNLRADVEGASALGIRTVWITRRVADPHAALAGYTGRLPDAQIRELRELRALL